MDGVFLKLFILSMFFCFTISNCAKLTSSSAINGKGRIVRQSQKCAVNVCFALDGSGSITQNEFSNQFHFSADTMAILRHVSSIRFGATQYASTNLPISALTFNDESVLIKLRDAQRAGGASAVSDGIAYCEQQFREFKNDINVIFLFTDGSYNRGVNPMKYIDLVKREYTHLKVFPVKVGTIDDAFFAGFSPVFEVDSFLDALDASDEIESYQSDVCQS